MNKENRIKELEKYGYKQYLDTNYVVRDTGVIMHYYTLNQLTPSKTKAGYEHVSINGTVGVHRVVATVFCDKKDTHTEVDHINGIKNDNRASNLRWCTRAENMGWRYGRVLTWDIINEIRANIDLSQKDLADKYNLCPRYISYILLNKTWKDENYTRNPLRPKRFPSPNITINQKNEI